MAGIAAQQFHQFDGGIADALVQANNQATSGLPHYLGAKIESLTAGNLRASVEVRREFVTPMGSLHGGVMAGLVDHVLGCVLYPLMKPGQWAATTEFKLNYLAAVRGGTLLAESSVLSLTKRVAVVRVEVTNEDRLACVAQGTLLVVDPAKKAESKN